ncbi:MAG: metallophosphoesterase [Firmicutes bacterium]|nr:metallophosphoesterase [Bacillota bacterium]
MVLKHMEYSGLLLIGDAHLASRTPGYRKEDYPEIVLGKVEWCLEHAREEKLLPVFLGDLFHYARDNATWLLVELIRLFSEPVLAIVGNHDVSTTGRLTSSDSLTLLVEAGRVRLVSAEAPWVGRLGSIPIMIGGSSYGEMIPRCVDRAKYGVSADTKVIWLTHHDVRFRGYEEGGRFGPFAIEGVDIAINGHIHRPLPSTQAGQTLWLNPGNITRLSRGETSMREPQVTELRWDNGWQVSTQVVPHRPFAEVFYEADELEEVQLGESEFIHGLEMLEKIRTDDGTGLLDFIERNRGALGDERVYAEIMRLAEEVIAGDHGV